MCSFGLGLPPVHVAHRRRSLVGLVEALDQHGHEADAHRLPLFGDGGDGARLTSWQGTHQPAAPVSTSQPHGRIVDSNRGRRGSCGSRRAVGRGAAGAVGIDLHQRTAGSAMIEPTAVAIRAERIIALGRRDRCHGSWDRCRRCNPNRTNRRRKNVSFRIGVAPSVLYPALYTSFRWVHCQAATRPILIDSVAALPTIGATMLEEYFDYRWGRWSRQPAYCAKGHWRPLRQQRRLPRRQPSRFTSLGLNIRRPRSALMCAPTTAECPVGYDCAVSDPAQLAEPATRRSI